MLWRGPLALNGAGTAQVAMRITTSPSGSCCCVSLENYRDVNDQR